MDARDDSKPRATWYDFDAYQPLDELVSQAPSQIVALGGLVRPNKAMQLTPSALSRCVFQMLVWASAQLIAVVRPHVLSHFTGVYQLLSTIIGACSDKGGLLCRNVRNFLKPCTTLTQMFADVLLARSITCPLMSKR